MANVLLKNDESRAREIDKGGGVKNCFKWTWLEKSVSIKLPGVEQTVETTLGEHINKKYLILDSPSNTRDVSLPDTPSPLISMRKTAKPVRAVGNVSPVTPILCMSSTALRTSLLIDSPATIPLLSSHTAAPHQKVNPSASWTLLASGSKHKAADTPVQFYPSKISKKMNTISVGTQTRQNMSDCGVQTKVSIISSSVQSTSRTLLGNHVGCQTDPPSRLSQGTQLSLRTLSPHVRSKGTQVSGSVSVEVGTTTTDTPWTTSCPLASPPFKALRPVKRPRLDVEEEDGGDLSTEVPEPQAPTDDPVESITVTVELSQFSSSEVMVNTQCLLELFQFCWSCQRECCTTIEGNEKLSSITQDCKSCGDRRDWRSHPPTSLSSDEEASLSEEEEKKKRKRKSDSVPDIHRSTEVMVNSQCLLELFQFCWSCQRECCTTIEGNEKLSSITQDCKSCGYHRDWRSHPPTSLSSDEEASLSEEEEKKKRKRKSDSSDEWEPCLAEETTDSDVSMDEDLFTALKEDGEGQLVVWCTQCEMEASLSCSVLQHKKVFCCSQCSAGDDIQTHNFETLPVQFDDVASFQAHVKQEHGAKPFNMLCQDCGMFVRANKEHVCEHKIKLIVCSDCGKRFLTEVGLKTHYSQLHSDYDHPCKYCLKVFKTKSAKLDHEQTHPKETQPYSCPDCPQKFSGIHKRNKHVKSHRGPHKYVCDVCKKGFRDITSLRRHKLIHSGEKPFKCQVCERSFNQLVNLTSHMRVHTGEKPFMCDQCGESFSHNISLKNHKQRHHDSGLTQEEEIMSDLEEGDV